MTQGSWGHHPVAPIGQVNTKTWTLELKRTGIENFKWHDLRQPFTTCQRQAGTPIHQLHRLGGWTTGRWASANVHAAPEAWQGAAARVDGIAGYAGWTNGLDRLMTSVAMIERRHGHLRQDVAASALTRPAP